MSCSCETRCHLHKFEAWKHHENSKWCWLLSWYNQFLNILQNHTREYVQRNLLQVLANWPGCGVVPPLFFPRDSSIWNPQKRLIIPKTASETCLGKAAALHGNVPANTMVKLGKAGKFQTQQWALERMHLKSWLRLISIFARKSKGRCESLRDRKEKKEKIFRPKGMKDNTGLCQ